MRKDMSFTPEHVSTEWPMNIRLVKVGINFSSNALQSICFGLLLSGGWSSVIFGEDHIIWDGYGVAEKYELSSTPPVHLHHSQVPYCWSLLDLGCLQIQIEFTSALNMVLQNTVIFMLILSHPHSHPECFKSDWCLPVSFLFWMTDSKHLKRAGFSERAEHLCLGSHFILVVWSWKACSDPSLLKKSHTEGVDQSCIIACTSETEKEEKS